MKLPDEKKSFADILSIKLEGLGLHMDAQDLRTLSHSALLLVLLAVLVAGAMFPHLLGTRYPVDPKLVGHFAEGNYKADRDYEIQDSVTTQRLRRDAAGQVLPVYDFDRDAGQQISDNILKSFNFLHKLARQPEAGSVVEDAGVQGVGREDGGANQVKMARGFYARLRKHRERFQQISGLLVSAESFDSIISASLDPDLGAELARALRKLMQQGLINERQSLLNQGVERISLRNLQNTEAAERA